MRVMYQWGMAFVLSLMAGLSLAGQQEQVEKLLELNGAAEQVKTFPDMFKLGVNQVSELPTEDRKVLTRMVDEEIRPKRIYSAVRDAVVDGVEENAVTSLISWYESDLGQKVTALEVEAAQPESYQEMIQMAGELLGDQTTLEQAARFDELLGISEFGVMLQENTAVAMYTAIHNVMQSDQPMDEAGLRKALAQQKPQWLQQSRQMTALSFAYTYQSLTDEELSRYLDFLATPASQAFNDAALAGMADGLSSAVKDWTGKIAVHMGKKAKQNQS